ncbi:MAG TPA: hypothetical protein VEH30_05045 [Terriglobales bacterium]|nr:hypothetical protein [Terriglobales bacterium]
MRRQYPFPGAKYMLNPESQQLPRKNEADFFPKGSIAFFVVMLVSFGLIWLGMYLLLVHRQLGL